jgi:hypothetical protein
VRVRSRVWNVRQRARADRHRILTESLRLEHSARTDTDTTRTLGETVPAGDGADPAVIVEVRDELRERAVREGLGRFARRHVPAGPTRRSAGAQWPRRYSDSDIATALELVADGKTVREAGAAVGTSHPTVLQWMRNAA